MSDEEKDKKEADPDTDIPADETPEQPIDMPEDEQTPATAPAADSSQAAAAPASDASAMPVAAAPVPSPASTLPPTPAEPNTVNVIGHVPPAQNALQRTAENMATADDLNQGKISPKTYGDLFASKGTLGKIGTLFGLLVSGAGSGLAHQSNAVMDMMNNEINRDLEAQKMNQSNKQNWYNLAMQHEKNLADIETQNATAEATRVGTYNHALDSEVKAYGLKTLPGVLDMSVSTNVKNNMLSAGLQHAQDIVNRMAPGPAQQQAQSTINNTLKPALVQQISKNNLDYANKKSVIDQMNPNPLKAATAVQTKNPRAPSLNQQLFQQGVQLGKVAPVAPGAISQEQAAKIKDEAGKLDLNRTQYADFVDSFNRLSQLKHAGQVPAANVGSSLLTAAGSAIGGVLGTLGGPLGTLAGAGAGGAAGNVLAHSAKELQGAYERQRDIEVEALKQRLGANMSDEAKNSLVNSLLPSWKDNDESRAEAYRKGTQHFSSNPAEKQAQTMEYFGLKQPNDFPALPYAAPKKTSDNANPTMDEKLMEDNQWKKK